jgi:hypothetical protein
VTTSPVPPTQTEAQSGTPLALDQIKCTDRFYGVPVSALGEDCDQGYVAFTSDRRRALAAVNRYRRGYDGERRNYLESEEFKYVQVFDHCGCEPHEDVYHVECDCPHWGLPPCQEDTFVFVQETCSPDAVNALPAFQLEVFS